MPSCTISWISSCLLVIGQLDWGLLQPITLPGHDFSFACQAPRSDSYNHSVQVGNIENVRNFTKFGLGKVWNAWDPGLELNLEDNVYEYVAAQRIPQFWYHPFRSTAPMTPEIRARMRILDDAGVWNSFNTGEWGQGFHCTEEGVCPNASAGTGWCKASNYHSPPTSRLDANRKVAGVWMDVLNLTECRLSSRPSWSYYLHEPLRWSLAYGCPLQHLGTGVEIGASVTDAQAHFAFSRGASRQFQTSWNVDVSPWHGGSEPSNGPVRLDNNGHTWRGLAAGHSVSYLRRQYLYSWFAGAGAVVAEYCMNFAFSFRGQPNAVWPNNTDTPFADMALTKPHGEMLAESYKVMTTNDRGAPYIFMAVVMDQYAGYRGSPCGDRQRMPWGAFAPSSEDLESIDLFGQIFPGSTDKNDCGAIESCETIQVRPTPYGEMVDVLQSDVSTDLLALYPVILLAGQISFSDSPCLLRNLEAAVVKASTAGQGTVQKIYMQAHHAAAIAAVNASSMDRLNQTGAVVVLPQWINPVTNRSAAIPTTVLRDLADKYQPMAVTSSPVGVQYAFNKLGGANDSLRFTSGAGSADWLVWLANNEGVWKPMNATATFDKTKTITVQLTPKFAFARNVTDLLGGHSIVVSKDGQQVQITLGPGEVAILMFSSPHSSSWGGET